jgi:prepilin-type N-terminal cleavage/methylation domain-containing protein
MRKINMKKINIRMLKHNICSRFKDPAGLTIIEVIVSIALFAIVAIFICDTLLFGINMINKAKATTKNSFQTAGAVIQKTVNSDTSSYASGTTVGSSSGTLTINFTDGTTVTIPGSYTNATTGGQTYNDFIPPPK